ncbi:MAG: DUF3570 domain-containing protein [bacterium]
MQKVVLKYSVVCSAVLFWVSTLQSDDKISLRTNIFNDNSGTSVHSPTVEIVKDILLNSLLSVRYSLDRVLIPPVRGLSATPSPVDGVTGASRPISQDQPGNQSFVKERNEIIVGLTAPGFDLSYYFSKENDYVGQMATLAANFDFNQKNSNLSLSYGYGWDRIEPLGADTLHTKSTHHFNLTVTQVLNKKVIARVGADLSLVSGFQSNPYRSVFAEGQHRLEIHPVNRKRAAVYLKVNRYFKTRTSLNMGYRFYRDNWQIQSHTVDIFYHQYFSEIVLIRYRYRYYVQSAAYFYRSAYTVSQAFMTSDYKLEPFTSHLFGLKLEYRLQDLVQNSLLNFLAKATFDAKYERYFSSNEFTADVYQIGLVFNY